MKKIIVTTGVFSSYLLAASSVFAQVSVDTCPKDQFSFLCTIGAAKFGGLVGAVINILFIIAVVIALAFLIYGGIKWILSGGDKTAVESARNTIVAAVVGLIIVFLSYFILNVILKFFHIDINNLVLPIAP